MSTVTKYSYRTVSGHSTLGCSCLNWWMLIETNDWGEDSDEIARKITITETHDFGCEMLARTMKRDMADYRIAGMKTEELEL